MNAEQLHAVCRELKTEIDSADLVDLLQQLRKALEQAVGQPQEAQHQNEIGKLRAQLTEKLTEIEKQERSVMKKQIIEELGATQLLGGALLQRINDSFTQKEVTLSLVKDDIVAMHSELTQFREGIEQLTKGFGRFKIGFEELAPYTAELGILIPRREHKDDLGFFAKDIGNLNKELQVFHELVTGKATNFKIRTISSSDFSVFLDVLPEAAQVIVSMTAVVLLGYEKLLDIRKKHQELKEDDAPESVTKSLEDWAETMMEEKIEEITNDLIKQYKDVKRPEGRENELRTSLRYSIRKVAGRLDVGYNFSARVGPPPEPENTEEPTAEENRQQEVVRAIKEGASKLEYRELSGDPVLPLDWQPQDKENDAGDTQGAEKTEAEEARKTGRKKTKRP